MKHVYKEVKLMYLIRVIVLIICVTTSTVVQARCVVFKPAFNLMAQRANLLKDVAAYKYLTHKSSYDAAQELKVLNNVDKIANDLGFDSYSLMQYAQIQMDMSKQIEEYWFNIWKNNPKLAPKPGQYKDLTLVREQIQAIDKQIYPALRKAIENQCSVYDVQDMFKSNFEQIKGIPITPDFSRLMVNGVLSIKAK